ncbi:MAG: hypothetical protein COU73_04610 [Parcubacteria group bacterium CG10_big_fil_rev_8_21_14_0_10_46_32]|nr:MAG: hypothetical protein COU73_04610 [Parcubacteria group bacterium CG10_big_fil_rev_8_21_14_0_10_46_32]
MWTIEEATALRGMVGRTYAYHTNKSDEFVIEREDGEPQGIFKVWAVPVIPFLDASRIDLLVGLWPEVIRRSPSIGFDAALTAMEKDGDQNIVSRVQEARGIMRRWQDRCVCKPERLARSLERARLYSWITDQQLARRYAAESLSDDLPQRITQLVNRLYLAFGLMNPFYHLEVLVDNPVWLCGTEFQEDAAGLAGRLDAAALLLPAVFRDFVFAEELNWNGLSWSALKGQTRDIFSSDPVRKKILINLARLTGAPPHHVLFAANALEWIPMRGGGKKRDEVVSRHELIQLSTVLAKAETCHGNVVSVLAETNALIRFMNWLPLIEGDENFAGQQWTYSSVCDTASQLFQTLYDNPGVWRPEFTEVFMSVIAPQLQHLDAQSAKGRLLLQLILEERRIRDAYFGGLDDCWQDAVTRSVTGFESSDDLACPTQSLYPFSLVGGKTFGLSIATHVIGARDVAGGIPIASGAVERLLKSDERLWNYVQQLDQEENLGRKILFSVDVRNAITECLVPEWFRQIVERGLRRYPNAQQWAVRSSAQEEGEARGVYGTELRVRRDACVGAAITCIASYYSRRAVTFRSVIGAGDLPLFSMLLQPYFDHQGGGGSYINGRVEGRYAVSVGVSAEDVTSGKEVLHEWAGRLEDTRHARQEVVEVISVLEQLSEVFEGVQVEWVQNTYITLLQMELLPCSAEKGNANSVVGVLPVVVNTEEDVDILVQLLSSSDTQILSVVLGSEIKLVQFQEAILELCARFGRRITEVQFEKVPSPSSHFSNICSYFGIRCVKRV